VADFLQRRPPITPTDADWQRLTLRTARMLRTMLLLSADHEITEQELRDYRGVMDDALKPFDQEKRT
jgi:hypothetical protein